MQFLHEHFLRQCEVQHNLFNLVTVIFDVKFRTHFCDYSSFIYCKDCPCNMRQAGTALAVLWHCLGSKVQWERIYWELALLYGGGLLKCPKSSELRVATSPAKPPLAPKGQFYSYG